MLATAEVTREPPIRRHQAIVDLVEVLVVVGGIAEAEVRLIVVRGDVAHHGEQVDEVRDRIELIGDEANRAIGLLRRGLERLADAALEPAADREVSPEPECEHAGDRRGDPRGPPPRLRAIASELGEQAAHRGVSIAGLDGETAHQDRAQRARDPRALRRRAHLAVAHGVRELVERPPAEWSRVSFRWARSRKSCKRSPIRPSRQR